MVNNYFIYFFNTLGQFYDTYMYMMLIYQIMTLGIFHIHNIVVLNPSLDIVKI